jgi:hypothetical protein
MSRSAIVTDTSNNGASNNGTSNNGARKATVMTEKAGSRR